MCLAQGPQVTQVRLEPADPQSRVFFFEKAKQTTMKNYPACKKLSTQCGFIRSNRVPLTFLKRSRNFEKHLTGM